MSELEDLGMATTTKEIQALGSLILGVASVTWGLYVLKTGSYTATSRGGSVAIGGWQATVVGWFFLVLGLLAIAAPFIGSWWKGRRDR